MTYKAKRRIAGEYEYRGYDITQSPESGAWHWTSNEEFNFGDVEDTFKEAKRAVDDVIAGGHK